MSLLIPTYNEAEVVIPALFEIQKELGSDLSSSTEVIIVDDGTDELPSLIEKNRSQYKFAALKVMRNHPPLGKGNSLAAGFIEASAPIVGFLDVDLSTPPRYIHEALKCIQDDRADIFIGSRRSEGSQVTRQQSALKDALGIVLGVVARNILFLGMKFYPDTQCGFKFYKNHIAKILYRDLVAPDGLNDLEVLIRANLLGYRVFEKGVQWTDIRESKRSLSRIFVGEVKAIGRIMVKYHLFRSTQREILHKLSQNRTKMSL
ncbi:MAG: glycosyltransferase [Oligoflexia bacterium]|nr:glycosyltransferase [Oligoflexia bacterium]